VLFGPASVGVSSTEYQERGIGLKVER